MQIDFYMLNPYTLFIIGAIILYFSSDMIISNSLSLSDKYSISKITTGVIALALGTSLPELFVSFIATLKGNDTIVIGNIIGSNIANIGLVLGCCIFFKPFFLKIEKNIIFNMFSLLIISFVFLYMLFNNSLVKSEGIVLLLLFCLYIIFLIKYFSKNIHQDECNNNSIYKNIFLLVIGFIMIYFGSEAFINGALGIANKFGLNDVVVGMTIVAIGTSCPELFTTFIAIKKNEPQLALGNIIGSNIINILIVGGLLSLVKDIGLNFENIYNHSLILVSLTILLVFSTIIFKNLNRILGVVFISIYFLFIFINF